LCSFRQAVDQYDLDAGVGPSPFLHFFNQDQITFAATPCGQLQLCNDPLYNIAIYGNVVFDNPNGVSLTVTGNGQAVTQIDGGGSADLHILDAAPVTFSDLTMFDGYSSDCGGGILNNGGTVTVNGSTLIDNTAVSDGAGICNLNGTVNLNEATVIGNNNPEPAEDGGGIYNAGGDLQINGSTIEDNGAGIAGGGIYNAEVGGTQAWLFGTTVEENTAGTYGGGVYNACGSFYFGATGDAVINNAPDNFYQQPCSSFPGFPPGFVFPGLPPGFPPGIGLIDPVP